MEEKAQSSHMYAIQLFTQYLFSRRFTEAQSNNGMEKPTFNQDSSC